MAARRTNVVSRVGRTLAFGARHLQCLEKMTGFQTRAIFQSMIATWVSGNDKTVARPDYRTSFTLLAMREKQMAKGYCAQRGV